jgi:HK97 gp10 family phage protein
VKVKVSVVGLKELDARLGQLKPSTGKNVLRRVGREALAPFDEDWRERAPHLTGALEESGSVGSKLTHTQRKQNERTSTVEVFAGPGPNPQAIQQEFGNATQPPQPYVRPAWDATKDQALEIVAERLGEEIDRTVARLAKRAAKSKG